jgi:hypothetical protein
MQFQKAERSWVHRRTYGTQRMHVAARSFDVMPHPTAYCRNKGALSAGNRVPSQQATLWLAAQEVDIVRSVIVLAAIDRAPL